MAEKIESKSAETSNEQRIEELRAEMQMTRAEMHRTLEELQDRLSPSTIKGELKEKVRGAALGKAQRTKDRARDMGSGIISVIRENPVPSLLSGVGIGWLIMKGRQQGNGAKEAPPGYLGAEAYSEDVYTGQTYSEAEAGVASKIYERAATVGEEAREKAREYSGKARQKIGETTGMAKGKAQELSGRAKELSVNVKSRSSDALQSNPFAIAVAALALGALAGLMTPATQRERELGTQIASGTQEKVRSKMEKARSVLSDVKETSVKRAQEEGII